MLTIMCTRSAIRGESPSCAPAAHATMGMKNRLLSGCLETEKRPTMRPTFRPTSSGRGLVSRLICLRNYVDRRPPSASHVGNRHLSAEIGYSQLGQRPSACHEADVNASGPAEPMRSPRTGALIGRLPILVFASRRRSRHLKGMNRSSERAITGNWLQHIPRVATYAEAR